MLGRCKSKAAVVKTQVWQIALLAILCTVVAGALAKPVAYMVVEIARESR